jgi:hypothetical protein
VTKNAGVPLSNIFQKSTDTNYAGHVLGKITLNRDNFAVLTCECDLLSPATSPLYTLFVTNNQGDSIQLINLTPFLGTGKNHIAVLAREKEVTTIYQDFETGNVIQYQFLWDESDRKFVEQQNELSPQLAREKFSLSDSIIMDKQEISLISDTLFDAECDLNLDGKSDRLVIIDPGVYNDRYETTRFCILKIDRQTSNGEYEPWVLSTTTVPTMSKLTDASSGDFVCSQGRFSFSHFDEGGGTLNFTFIYSRELNELILEKVVFTNGENKIVPCCDHENPALPDFDYNADEYLKH